MAKWDEDLPPIMRERLAKIGDVTPEERARMKDTEQLESLLSQFYKGDLSAEGLWSRLKQYRDEGKGHLLREAQLRLIDTIGSGSGAEELRARKDAILAVETLKESQNTPTLETLLNSIDGLQKRRKQELDQAYNSLKAQVDRNPQLRMQQVRQGQSTMVVQLTVDEAVRILPEWKNFVVNHDRQYAQEFAGVIESLKGAVK